MAFWRDIMKFEVVIEPVILPKAENKAIGWSDQADVRFARLQSPQGAGIALLEVKQDGYHDLELRINPSLMAAWFSFLRQRTLTPYTSAH